jgi:hypothetical protein
MLTQQEIISKAEYYSRGNIDELPSLILTGQVGTGLIYSVSAIADKLRHITKKRVDVIVPNLLVIHSVEELDAGLNLNPADKVINILCFDGLELANDDIKEAIHKARFIRKIGTYKLPKNCLVVTIIKNCFSI